MSDKIINNSHFHRFEVGVHTLTEPLVIPQKRPDFRELVTGVPGMPGTYLAQPGKRQWPAGELAGEGIHATVLNFVDVVSGPVVKTQYQGTGNVGGYWNSDNYYGNTAQKSVLCASFHDITINFGATIRPGCYTYFDGRLTDPKLPTPGQYAYQNPAGTPWLDGPDFQPYADGVFLEGSNTRVSNVHITYSGGTALSVWGAAGPQGGATGIYDGDGAFVNNVWIGSAWRGFDINSGDAKLSNIFIGNCVTDGLYMRAAGGYTINAHLLGCDRAFVFAITGEAYAIYAEASRIAVHFEGNASGSSIMGLNIGPATTYYRSVKCDSSGNRVYNIHGTVRANETIWPDIAGVEYDNDNLVHNYLEGSMSVNGTSTGVILRGRRGFLDLMGGIVGPASNAVGTTDPEDKAKYVDVRSETTSYRVNQQYSAAHGIGLDLLESRLDMVLGRGNMFHQWPEITGSAKAIRYPDNSPVYNLAKGTEIRIENELQGVQTALLTGATAYWPMDQASGNEVDAVNGLVLVDTNSVTSAAGNVYTTARAFNGTNQRFSLADTPLMSLIGSPSFQFAVWVYLTGYGDGQALIFGKDNVGSDREYGLRYDHNVDRFSFDISTNGTNSVGVFADYFGAVTLNTWNFVCCGRSKGAQRIWISVNCGLRNQSAALATVNGANAFQVGARNSDHHFPGRIGPLGFWNGRMLSHYEEARLYAKTKFADF